MDKKTANVLELRGLFWYKTRLFESGPKVSRSLVRVSIAFWSPKYCLKRCLDFMRNYAIGVLSGSSNQLSDSSTSKRH